METANQDSDQINRHTLLRLRQVLQLVPISKSSWYDGVRNGRYPQPVKLGPRTTAWRESDILALIDSLARQTGRQRT